ncbi:class A beta-lactamase [Phenylobacterium sp.]|uniref:class A beta-lactamase n=1 Tax=Phenylobacterium sp. TaxID=1871053 RepID=UPI002DE7EDF0|nr:class A beta-lactamase [Phenylobacterium sp.]
MLTRRDALALAAAGVALPARAATSFEQEMRDLERDSGNRIGVSAVDAGSGRRLRYKPTERIAMCSTFKLLATGAVLARVDAGHERLERRLRVDKADVVGWAPVTEKHIGEELPLATLCEAAMTLSDNGAANLLLNVLGGPPGVTAYARSLGDPATRLDRREPELNRVKPGDPRDTTTPDAMVADLRKLALGGALSPASRERLVGWMVANQTGDECLRAGVPKGWRVGDKTGTGPTGGAVNDVAIFWPPGRAPILIAAYTDGGRGETDERRRTLVAIARIVTARL